MSAVHPVKVLCALLIAGCLLSCGPRKSVSTRLTADDFYVTEQKIRQDLASSSFLANRGPDSEPMVIVVNKVENLTSDIITEAEQWMAVQRVIDSLPVQELRQTKNIRIILPRERYEQLRDDIGHSDQPTDNLNPTHLMYAQFESSTRAARSKEMTDSRTEYYYLAYRITDIQGREIGWSSSFEFQREASGTVID